MDLRPKPGETEDDILKQQEEFLKNKHKPSAQVIKCGNSQQNTPQLIKNETQNDNLTSIIQPILVGNIIERKTSVPPVIENASRFSSGFPVAKRRQGASGTKQGSIFSQQNKKLKPITLKNTEVQKMEIDNTTSASTSVPINEFTSKSITNELKNLPAQSYILTGKECDEIHKDNLETLNKMSEQEIIEEQQKLMSSLDPDIVRFLKSKRNNNTKKSINTISSDETENLEHTVDVDCIEAPKEIINNSFAENWLHFNAIETEKLQWMKDIEIPKKPGSNEPYEARFDFAGWLLPFVEPEISEKNRVLYHHGEDPGRPGYTIKELFKLCRSNVQQQRILALNTISNILSLNSTGVYDGIIEIPIEQIFFVLRVSIDDNTPAILNASIKAMHHLFYNQIDEACLDSLLGFGCGFIQPTLTVEKELDNREDEKEINDQQLAELDLIKCLARTDILIRIRYIINTVKPTTETIVYCLELLIRLMRDSQQIMAQVFNCEDLFSSIIQHFVPKVYKLDLPSTICYGVPLVSAIKLIRIAATRSKTIAQELINRYNVIDSLISYISNDIRINYVGVQIQTEAFNLLAVFFHYNLAIDQFSDLQPFLIRAIDYHFRNTDITLNSSYMKQKHFSGVLNIISQVTKIDIKLISNFISLLMQCTAKYCAQVSNLSDFKCGNLQILSSLLICLTNIIKWSSLRSDDFVEKCVDSLIASNGFRKITSDIKLGSNLLCEYESRKSGANFNSVEAVVWPTSEHVVPNLHSKSCIPFLNAISYFISIANDQLILKFLQHPNITNYLTLLKNSPKYNLTSNWFTIERHLAMNILKSVVRIQNSVSNPMFYFALAVKSLSIFTLEQKSDVDLVLKNIVFNKMFFPNEILMANLELNASENVELNPLHNLDEIYDCYSNVLGLKTQSSCLATNLTIDIRVGNIIPLDWVFCPIVSLYSDHHDNQNKQQTDEIKQRQTITQCLQWIFLYENYFPELASFVNVADRFCRLCCIFLCSNSLFLESDIHKLLDLCLKVLIKPENLVKLDFDKEIQGLTNFQDFYVQLLEQFQGVSYGDKLFANFILVPLAQRHNVKWRKVVWSEYIGVTQAIFLDTNESYIDVKEFLIPQETDLSVLKCYKRALVSGQLNRSPLLKHIAKHHVDSYVATKKQ